ncbi:MAG TPA: glycoside hydrolase family 15 protein [Acidimicrobiia bacterium]|nr:glycoside hydrolase family 15 protein [Acidimicrobiia bacterium]
MDRAKLIETSVGVITLHQADSGAYPASPNYPTYQYCWFRDGSFIARAMDVGGRFDSSSRFHHWAAAVIVARSDEVDAAVADPRSRPRATLDTRYQLDGSDGKEKWSNFQLDGFGTWLWALERHISDSKADLPSMWSRASNLAAEYLTAHWDQPCYDLWEELPEHIHVYTLGAIHAGLSSHQRLTGIDHTDVIDHIAALLNDRGVVEGRLIKYLGDDRLDASLVALGVPYGVFDPAGPVMTDTVAAIEDRLTDGGVHRYPGDTFYGGGQWPLLTAWLAWHHLEVGNAQRAEALLRWVEAQTDDQGNLPEQVSTSVNDSDWVEPWIDRWGPVANPLLWSHAMYLLAVESPPTTLRARP